MSQTSTETQESKQDEIHQDLKNESQKAKAEDDTKTLSQWIELGAHFSTFIDLKDTLDKYQRKNHVQLIVKDSKLLRADSTKKVISKNYHLVNQSLMYHSITYCCKCHGFLKQKAGSRIKNIGSKRLNCQMYLRFKLSSDLQSLVLYDMQETHNHPTDPNTFQLAPRQQRYRLLLEQRGEPETVKEEPTMSQASGNNIQTLIAVAAKDMNSIDSLTEKEYEPPTKTARKDVSPNITLKKVSSDRSDDEEEEENDGGDDDDDEDDETYEDNSDTLLDPDSSCCDSDEEEFRNQRHLLSFPIRLIGAAVQASPELLLLAKDLIQTQKENLLVAKRKLLLETKLLELKNEKLSLEVKHLEKTLAAPTDQTTTFYLQS